MWNSKGPLFDSSRSSRRSEDRRPPEPTLDTPYVPYERQSAEEKAKTDMAARYPADCNRAGNTARR